MFTSDNGGERFSNMWPLTGMKGELLEGGIRVPLIVSYPGVVPARSTTSQIAMSMDMLPTLHSASGGAALAGVALDGLDLAATLRSPAVVSPREVFWRHRAGNQAAVRRGDWKYLRSFGREYLFNLVEDERERADRAKHETAIFQELKVAFEAWNATMLPYPEHSFSESADGKYPDRP